ncbi:MATE family efflux transporter [Mycolicibacter hiberniae]|uniref:DNA-damage-inducible protein DinF n=1 Tax=Mycolicibacter hiberniae TaxID=29314 RepID=A0A7I7X3Z4_9MYCO|nr:MATE family efflux transporter [Mycolicibacter hiberniae]MCV7087848.1 MATE family efflux transporter [Mycolicibacter hiberniae]ORV66747.1 MATE family efflux transporter [Mycolicibacter hiberniae]BBZ23587.1 DNA-damage-inducible protein DinF [Mycolicibacter hiberniae]
MHDSTAAGGRQIAALAMPALVVLAAEPLYLLFDTAVVGRLGALGLAGLAIGGLILGLVGSQATFLSYGTTARAARHYGAGDRPAAVAEGVQATWLALGLGVLVVVVVQAAAVPLVAAVAGRDSIAQAALPWLRIAILGVPAILVSLAGNGWLRGVQDTSRSPRYVVAGFALSAVLCPLLVFGALGLPRWGLAGSAVANCAGQWLAALLFLRALGTEQVSLRLDAAVLRRQLVLGRDLIVRSLAFQACFVSAAAVAARFGAAALAAHQIVLQLWTFLALVLDSLAIAAQALVGAALGAGHARQARSVAARVTAFSAIAAGVLAAAFAAGRAVLPELFTGDAAVLAAIGVPWWFLVAQLPLAGIVFALDGVLLGAGDAAFMRTATVVSALIGFLPLTWLALVLNWGLAGIWSGLTTFIVLRLLFVGWRALSGRWVRAGQP